MGDPKSTAKLKQQAKAAWRGPLHRQKDGTIWAWHFHHEELAEPIYGDGVAGVRRNALERIDDITYNKPHREVAVRLQRFRPIRGEVPEAALIGGARHESLQTLHKQECKNCPYSTERGLLYYEGGDPK